MRQKAALSSATLASLIMAMEREKRKTFHRGWGLVRNIIKGVTFTLVLEEWALGVGYSVSKGRKTTWKRAHRSSEDYSSPLDLFVLFFLSYWSVSL